MTQIDEKSQLKAKEYVLNKRLTRPKTTLWAPVLLLLVLGFTGVAVGFVLAKIFGLNVINSLITIVVTTIVFILFVIKKVLILLIECYQHYAPENIRRCCLCMPTCSEYSIMVLEKYCLTKALILIYIRLKKTCTGNTYKIDYP